MNEKEPLKYIAILPSIITLMNGFFGFLAIVIASHEPGLRWQIPLLAIRSFSYPEIAAWMIIMGMIADMLDGRIARNSGSTSNFGGQLDSLCDAVTFGVAPALLSYKMCSAELVELKVLGFRYANLVGRWVLFTAIIYAMCALVRLARFNVENAGDDAHMSFAGLPSPAGAGLLVSLILFHEDLIPRIAAQFSASSPIVDMLEKTALWSIPVALFISGILMVSRIHYPHVANKLFHGKKPFSSLIFVIFAGFFALWNIHIALLLGFSVFALYGLVGRFAERLRIRRHKQCPPDDNSAPEVFDGDPPIINRGHIIWTKKRTKSTGTLFPEGQRSKPPQKKAGR